MDPMSLAIKEAQKALSEGEVPVGAVLVRNGEILCMDHNRREQTGDPTAHAELLCLRSAGVQSGNWRLEDCTLYVTLEPCPMCAGAMVMSRLGHCVYGAADPEKGCCGSVYDLPADPAFRSPTRWSRSPAIHECEDLLSSFFQKKRELSGKKP